MAETRNDEILSDGLERVSQSAAYLGVSRSQIYKWLKQGILPSVKIGHSRRIPVRSVRRLAAAHLTLGNAVGPL